ncbi:hypothetical protein [Paenibacillus dendritiformis]|uniref:hypothetical protein n=1 Tax=Paenibacillus dendritiformis TaxID=130049 RepID=UPI0018CCEE28|nr:hypothetical protein [Paenibacillus dendritiformis]
MKFTDDELIHKAVKAGFLQQDPQWVDRLDEPVPLRVLLEWIIRMHDDLHPPHKPFD